MTGSTEKFVGRRMRLVNLGTENFRSGSYFPVLRSPTRTVDARSVSETIIHGITKRRNVPIRLEY